MTFATTLSRVAALCLLAGAAHAAPVSPSASAPAPASAADSSVPVPATVYTPAAGYRPAAAEPAGPAQVWREQNRIAAGATRCRPGKHMPATIAAAMSIKTASAMQCGATMACCAKGDGAGSPSCAPATAAAGAPAHAGHQHGGHH